ncbi:MAG: beta-ketoacyl-ACP synthase, partial [Armatimonadota bacterium]
LSIKAMQEGVIPHTLNCEDPEYPNLDIVRGEPREAQVGAAMSNSFGFGGHNIALIVRRFEG